MSFSRRTLLAAGAASALPAGVSGAERRKGRLRVAHFTDVHIQPELHATEGATKAWQHLMGQRPKPELVLVGGDMVMDAWSADKARTQLQWDLYQRVKKDNMDVPAHHAIGNHDLWGVNKDASHTTGQEALWAKKWFLDAFGYARTYHSFDFRDWHFVILDNVFVTPDGYSGVIDVEQLEWLKDDLSGTKKPTLLVSHIPLLSVTGIIQGYDAKAGDWTVGGNILTKNGEALRGLFQQYPHVKIAVSGHVHMVDRVDYMGVSYLCGGAVCGSWWKGWNYGFPPGYRLIDLYPDGSFEDQYLPWGWTQQD